MASYGRDRMVWLFEKAKRLRDTDIATAVEVAREALDIAERIDDREYQYECGYILGRCLNIQGDADAALDVLSQTLSIARQYFSHDKRKLTVATNTLGIVYYSMDNQELALNYYLKALQFDVKEENVKIYNNLSNIYTNNRDFIKALEYLGKGVREAELLEDEYMMAILLLNHTSPNIELGNMEVAKEKCLRALTITDGNIQTDSRFIHLRIHVLLNLCDVHIREKEYNRALNTIDEALAMAEKRSAHMSYCVGLSLKAAIYLEKDEETNALEYVNKTLEYAERYKQGREKKEILEKVIAYYEDKEAFDKAYPFLKRLKEHHKKEAILSRDENFKKIISDREKEIQLLADKNREIGEQNLLLEQFAHIISHDLKEPIRNIVSFSSLLERRLKGSLVGDGSEFLKYIIKGATAMNQNLTRLLDFTTLKKLKVSDIQSISFSKLIPRLEKKYQYAIEPFEVNISYPDMTIPMVYEHVYALLDEIISNAIQFRKPGKHCYIEVNCFQQDNKYFLSIKDYGIGIEREYRRQIFKMFNRLNRKDYNGSGVGLAICERIISIYKGEIWVDSEVGNYTTLHCSIPTLDQLPEIKKDYQAW